VYDIEQLRKLEFPSSSEQVYFNHASISPLPMRTRKLMEEALHQLSGQPMTFFMKALMPVSEQLTQEIAAFINAQSAQEIVPVSSTSAGLSAIARAIDWKPGDNRSFLRDRVPFERQSLAQSGAHGCGSATGSGR
jgi:selenocysteine lyase/cysteine desulfurase